MRNGSHEDVIKFLLDEGADPNLGVHPDFMGENVGPTDRKSGIALNTAAWTSSPEVFDLLLAKGAKLEYATPLHWVVWAHVHSYTSGTEMITHLVNMGVDLNGVDERQVVDEANRVGRPLEITQRPCEHGGPAGEKREAPWEAAKEVTELLLELGADIITLPDSPDWYLELIEKVINRKGMDKMCEDVEMAAAKALPHWRPENMAEGWAWEPENVAKYMAKDLVWVGDKYCWVGSKV